MNRIIQSLLSFTGVTSSVTPTTPQVPSATNAAVDVVAQRMMLMHNATRLPTELLTITMAHDQDIVNHITGRLKRGETLSATEKSIINLVIEKRGVIEKEINELNSQLRIAEIKLRTAGQEYDEELRDTQVFLQEKREKVESCELITTDIKNDLSKRLDELNELNEIEQYIG